MDERELAGYVLSMVDQAACRNAVGRVLGVRLAIGGRRVFDLQQLNSAFDQAAHGTVAEGARLHVQMLPVRHHCLNCGNDFDSATIEGPCTRCGHFHTEARSGEEVRLLDIQVDEPQSQPSSHTNHTKENP